MRALHILSKAKKQNGLSKVPLVEIAGHRRVLIENHLSVIAYSTDEITIKVGYGIVTVLGSSLELAELSREQLVITGQIDGVQLVRR